MIGATDALLKDPNDGRFVDQAAPLIMRAEEELRSPNNHMQRTVQQCRPAPLCPAADVERYAIHTVILLLAYAVGMLASDEGSIALKERSEVG